MKFSVFLAVLLAVFVVVTAFPTPQESEESGVPDVICKQQMKRGQCRALIPRWTYDVKKGICAEFKYGGCGGNGNNFKSRSECEATCIGVRK